MQQRRFAGVSGEVVAVLDPDVDIRGTEQGVQRAGVEPGQIGRGQDEGAGDEHRHQHRHQGRHDAIDAALVEVFQGEGLALDFGEHLGSDQEAGNDEENIDTDEAARQQAGSQVVH
ncbi:hypothetical protein D3C76_1304300 [compost metagenome]